MRNPDFCLCENIGEDQLCSNCTADQRLCSRYRDSTIHLLSKSEIFSLWLSSVRYSPVYVRPGRKPQRPVFSRRGPFDLDQLLTKVPCSVTHLFHSRWYIVERECTVTLVHNDGLGTRLDTSLFRVLDVIFLNVEVFYANAVVATVGVWWYQSDVVFL